MTVASALTVAALLGCSLGLAQAASPPGAAGTQAAPPPPTSTHQETPGASEQTGESSAEHGTSGQHLSYRTCSKQAQEKNPKGADRKQFIKDCAAGKNRG